MANAADSADDSRRRGRRPRRLGARGAATRWAARLAVLLDVPLHVVRAWSLTSAPRPKTAAPGYVPPITDFEQAVREQLEAHVAGLDLPEACQVNCHVVHAALARALLQAAERG